MNKNTLLLSLVAVVAVAVIYTLVNDDDIKPNNYQAVEIQDEKTVLKADNSNSNIEYKESKKVSSKENTKKKSPKPKREKYLETWVKDRSKKFEIALYNPNQDISKDDGRYRSVQGTIDGQYFNLPVPLHLIQEGSGDVKLRIKNLETGEITYTVAAFIDDMTSPAVHHKLTIDSSDPDNYQQESQKQVPPPRPGM